MAKKGNNEGSIYKDSKGRWCGAVTLPSTGKVRKKYFYGKTKKEVTDKVNELLRQLQNKIYIEPCKMTLYKWLCTWLESYNCDIRMTTMINYETYVHKHIRDSIGGYKLSELTAVIIQQFYNEKSKSGRLNGSGGLSPKTLRNLHNMLHKALNQAVYLEMISKNPSDLITLPRKQKKEMKYFTVDEQKQLQEALNGERLEMAILLDLYTGMRQGELLGLPWKNVHIDLNGNSYIRVTQTLNRTKNSDVDSEHKTILCINEPKTAHSIRNIPLIPEIAERLERHRMEQADYHKHHGYPDPEFVFTSTTGTLIEPRDFQRDFKKLLKKNGICEINVHGLRHTYAVRALESGMSVKTLSAILGHSSSSFTMDVYCHVTEDFKNEEVAKLSSFL